MSTTRQANDPVEAHIATFDFDVFGHPTWDRVDRSDIVVHWPDGHETRLCQHTEDLKAMFVYAPDTRITSRPITIGSDEWTCMIGTYEGTFTRPMPTGNGKTIQPTGKPFKLVMCTVGRWKDGVMSEEYLFWDNQTFMRQVGLAP